MSARGVIATLLACAFAAAAASCGSPVHDDAVAAMGEDPTGEHPGPTHRAGQSCLVCHGWLGPASPEFSVAGTVFKALDEKTGVAGAHVILTSADGSAVQMETNSAGNFYVRKEKWVPKYPMLVTVQYGSIENRMLSPVGRDGSCGDCHAQDATGDRSHPPYIYVTASAADFPQ